MKVIQFEHLSDSDLIVDAVYESSTDGQLAGEPISKLVPGLGNMGGFRYSGTDVDKKVLILFTTGEDKDWPDSLDLQTGKFVYFGDNKTPGHELHDTRKGGNKILKRMFDVLHSSESERSCVPPILIFQKLPTERAARSVQFKGLAVPGFPGMSFTDDLVAVWKTSDGQRFQNYRATFTVLDVSVIPRQWIDDIAVGKAHESVYAPAAWKHWIESGSYKPLTSDPTTIIRSDSEQLPQTPIQKAILDRIWRHFDHPNKAIKTRRAFVFERFAARIFQMLDQRVIVDEITQGVRDGGRDAVGRYLMGVRDDPVYAEFALEAKCYCPGLGEGTINRVGTRETARLISRIRHRQFGVMVTTSSIDGYTYGEVREDRHPIIFICGKDICELLINAGFNTPESVEKLLKSEFSVEVQDD